MFLSCKSIYSIKATGFKNNLEVLGLFLSGSALNTLYTNLATVIAKTITVTGNHGNTADDPSIATAKGWTVTG
jgi:hypothetical protein